MQSSPLKPHCMKKFLLPVLASALLIACNTNDTATVKAAKDSTTTTTTATTTAPLNLPFTVERTPDWVPGEPAHVAVAMNTLKAYVDNNMSAIGQYLADSVEFYADAVAFKGTRDSLVKFFSDHRNLFSKIDIRMNDYETVKSKNRGEEWVGLWYVETSAMKNGSIDSAMVMDDIKIVNGKVAIIDSKGRRLTKK